MNYLHVYLRSYKLGLGNNIGLGIKITGSGDLGYYQLDDWDIKHNIPLARDEG